MRVLDFRELESGNDVKIVRYTMDNPFTLRLRELGLVPGRKFTILRKALFGGPLQIQVGDISIGLRPTSFSFIELEKV